MKVPVFLVVTLGEIRGRVTQSQTCHTSALAQWSITVDGWLVPPVGEQYTQDRVTRMEEWGGKKGGRLSLRFTCRCLAWKRHLNHGLVSTNANSKPISRFFYICTGLVRYSTRFHHLISPSYKVWRTMIRRNGIEKYFWAFLHQQYTEHIEFLQCLTFSVWLNQPGLLNHTSST